MRRANPATPGAVVVEALIDTTVCLLSG